MSKHNQLHSIKHWLADLRACFISDAPELISLFDTYSEEATFGRRYIESDLKSLKPDSRILEVGAGSLLLSCQLVREGFHVTSLEPIGIGFSHFKKMRQIVIDRATSLECAPEMLNIDAETLDRHNCYDYAFSVNVMEHVHNVDLVLDNVVKSLVIGASYRFTCPNYYFPYEPHFDIITLFSKSLTEKLYRSKILDCERMNNPLELWESLNWINVSKIAKIANRNSSVKVSFYRKLTVSAFERISLDPMFAKRRSYIVRKIILFLVVIKLHKIFQFIPAMFQPVIDVRLQKIIRMETD